MIKYLKILSFGFITSLVLFITACCVICRLNGVEKVVIPKHVILNPSLYVVIKEHPVDSLYKEVYYKGEKMKLKGEKK